MIRREELLQSMLQSRDPSVIIIQCYLWTYLCQDDLAGADIMDTILLARAIKWIMSLGVGCFCDPTK